MTEAIRDEYLSKQKKRAEAVVRAVRDRCRVAGIAPPAANTVRARVRRVRADKAARVREGSGSAAARRLTPVVGQTPAAAKPMAVLQVDHTPVDLILVDETWRKPVGRPWLSVAIDTYSRCVAGLHLSYEAPSATVAGLCVAHAALDKAAYLRGLGIEADWPCQGRPDEVFVDNGSEFHSAAFERGCQQHGIALRFRPKGAPHWGGIVERLVGTAMAMVHELPGTTFSNPAERGEYDSDATACLTLAPSWSAGLCWRSLAPTTTRSMAAWASRHSRVGGAVLPSMVRRPRSPTRTRSWWTFCPCCAVASHARASSPITSLTFPTHCARWWLRATVLGPVLVRRDPRDLSRVWVLDPDGGGTIEVSCSRQGRPRISLHEHRLAVTHLREQGRAQVDEDAIFAAVEQQREIVREAAQRTRSARKQLAPNGGCRPGCGPPKACPVPPPRSDHAPQTVRAGDVIYDLEPYAAERW